jgi:hypothetical protein
VLQHHVKAAAAPYQRELEASLTFDALASVVHDLAASGSASADTPQHVVHMMPADDMRSFGLCFASRHMRDLFFDRMERAGADRVRDFVAAAETSLAMASLRGQLFERLAMAVLCRSGDALPLFALGEAARGAQTLEPLVDRDVLFFRTVEEAASSVRSCQAISARPPLCRPRASNFPTWYAAAVDADQRLTLYQATVSSAHDAKAKGFEFAARRAQAVVTVPHYCPALRRAREGPVQHREALPRPMRQCPR